jgi:hypothetical protein
MLIASATTLPVLLGAVGCRSSQLFAGPDPLAGPPRPSGDVITLQAVIAAEGNLIEAYQAAISGASRTPAPWTLVTLLTEHELHLAQLQARLVLPPAASPAAGRPRPAPSATGLAPARPSVALLRAVERISARDLVRQLATVPPALAQLFASIAACHATHVAVLGG